MFYDAKAIANYFIDKAREEGKPLSQMKLQKLVYYAHGWALGLTGQPLLNEQIQAWSFGPVIRSLYDEFREYGSGEIKRKAVEMRINPGRSPLEDIFQEFEPSIADYPAAGPDNVRQLLDQIWKVYGGLTAFQLSNMTHAPDTPWDLVSKLYQGSIPKYTTIPAEWIKDHFRRWEAKDDRAGGHLENPTSAAASSRPA